MADTVFDIPDNGQPGKLKVMVHDLSQPEATSTTLVDADSLGGANFANADLEATGDRTHNFNKFGFVINKINKAHFKGGIITDIFNVIQTGITYTLDTVTVPRILIKGQVLDAQALGTIRRISDGVLITPGGRSLEYLSETANDLTFKCLDDPDNPIFEVVSLDTVTITQNILVDFQIDLPTTTNFQEQLVFENGVGKKALIEKSISIPKLYVTLIGRDRENQLLVHYKTQANDYWHSLNPQIFLLRHKRRRKNKKMSLSIDKQRKRTGIVHPADYTASANNRWAGWKFFNGLQKNINGTSIDNRNTEFSIYPIPLTLQSILRDGTVPDISNNKWKPNQNLIINFEAYQYTINEYNEFDVQSSLDYYAWNSNRTCKVTGEIKAGVERRADKEVGPFGNFKMIRKQQAIKFQFVIAVDNLLATKTNGLCPKVFGEPSEIFISRNYNKNNGDEVKAGIGKRYFKV
jgi:hypothetical protein